MKPKLSKTPNVKRDLGAFLKHGFCFYLSRVDTKEGAFLVNVWFENKYVMRSFGPTLEEAMRSVLLRLRVEIMEGTWT